MIAEAMKKVEDLADKAGTPKVVDYGPREKLVAFNGTMELKEAEPSPRNHAVACLADVIQLANRFASGNGRVVVWYDEKAVVLVIDDMEHRLEKATFTLQVSDVFAKIVALKKGDWFEPKPFVRLLRIDLAGTLPPGILLDKVRNYSFETTSQATGTVRRDGESLGRSINATVVNGKDLPEEVTLSAPVYKNPGERNRLPIRCAFEADADRCAFQLIPLPDEIERVYDVAVMSIAERLNEGLAEGVPCYYGKP